MSMCQPSGKATQNTMHPLCWDKGVILLYEKTCSPFSIADEAENCGSFLVGYNTTVINATNLGFSTPWSLLQIIDLRHVHSHIWCTQAKNLLALHISYRLYCTLIVLQSKQVCYTCCCWGQKLWAKFGKFWELASKAKVCLSRPGWEWLQTPPLARLLGPKHNNKSRDGLDEVCGLPTSCVATICLSQGTTEVECSLQVGLETNRLEWGVVLLRLSKKWLHSKVGCCRRRGLRRRTLSEGLSSKAFTVLHLESCEKRQRSSDPAYFLTSTHAANCHVNWALLDGLSKIVGCSPLPSSDLRKMWMEGVSDTVRPSNKHFSWSTLTTVQWTAAS